MVRSTLLMWTQRAPYRAFFISDTCNSFLSFSFLFLFFFFFFLIWERISWISNLIYSQGWSWICDHTRISGLTHHAWLKPVLYDKNSKYFIKWRRLVSRIISPETWADYCIVQCFGKSPCHFLALTNTAAYFLIILIPMKSRYWVNINDLYWTRHGGANLYPLQWIWQGKRTRPRPYTKTILKTKQVLWLTLPNPEHLLMTKLFFPTGTPRRHAWEPVELQLSCRLSSVCTQKAVTACDNVLWEVWTGQQLWHFSSAQWEGATGTPKCSQAALDSTGLETNPFTLHPPCFTALESLHEGWVGFFNLKATSKSIPSRERSPFQAPE